MKRRRIVIRLRFIQRAKFARRLEMFEMIETNEREMVRKLDYEDELETPKPENRFTSLQPTYEDTVPPNPEEAWEYED
jgi:hypothetical protein